MGSIAFPAPVLPGKEAMPAEIGARLTGHPGLQGFLANGGLSLVRVYQMTTPMGDVVTTYQEADSIERSFQNQVDDPSDVAQQLRDHIKGTHGIDIGAQPPPSAEQYLEFSVPGSSRHPGIAFSAPIQPGKTDLLRALGRETAGPRSAEWEANNRENGVNLHRAYIISTPMGDFTSVYFEAPDPTEANRRFAANASDFAAYFKSQVADALGIDFNEPLPPITTVFEAVRASD
ncbi:hypothetical protein [Arthrobacter sp. MMS18-M83]|uniref:hypothetical protein n=1 Tax=Arthrobacter sp. MMS18-M83 TaxID=2996261 RepID=UPI00227D4924|nr:hypothetical protein [Arthrobacter sp. MMS18-M83]WAH97385.1 hypothetical protein OW521_00290 [Arthrobacter sp. MMS18-M83]